MANQCRGTSFHAAHPHKATVLHPPLAHTQPKRLCGLCSGTARTVRDECPQTLGAAAEGIWPHCFAGDGAGLVMGELGGGGRGQTTRASG